MIGIICSVFHGETYDSCLHSTEEALRVRYEEAKKIRARNDLRFIRNMLATQNAEFHEELTEELEVEAYPLDLATERDMTKEDILRVGAFFEGFRKPNEAPFVKVE